ncbi:MAG: glycine betaine ABC transporter substrate-binding protein [Synergistota bacterium]|nr:glycine betaine ABC transporter substrate-binding protein [Synergistota bacterium]
MRKMLLMLVVVCVSIGFVLSGAALSADKVIVGAKNFTEQYIVGNMMAKLLEKAGYDVETKMGTGSTVTRKALETGQTDMYPEYTGTAWSLYLENDSVITDPAELYEKVKAEDLEKNGILWLGLSNVNNTYAMAVTQEAAEEMGTTLSDMAAFVNEQPEDIIFGIDQEFYERSDGFFGLAEHYGMEVDKDQVRTMEVGLTFEAMMSGQVDVTMVFATDGKIQKYNLVVLEDDRQFFPVYNLCVSARNEFIEEHPDVVDILAPIGDLTDSTMQKLNYEVDVNGKPAEMVAEEYLKEKGLL